MNTLNVRLVGLIGIFLSGTLVAMETIEGDDEKALTRLTQHAPKKELYALFATMHQENSSLAPRLLERIIAHTKVKNMLNRESEVEKLFADPRYTSIATPRLTRKISLALSKLRSVEYQKSPESVSFDGLWQISKIGDELKLTGQNSTETGCRITLPISDTREYTLTPLQKLCICKLARKRPGQETKHLQDIVSTMPAELQMLLSRKVADNK